MTKTPYSLAYLATVTQKLIAITALIAASSTISYADEYNDLRGKTMQQVKGLHGEPINIRGPVGGLNAQRPPITQWEYDGFFVTFENQIAIVGFTQGSLSLKLDN